MNPSPKGRFRFAPEQGPQRDDYEESEWLHRQFRAIAQSLDQVDQLDVSEAPPDAPGFVPQVGMIRYLQDTPLGYGPGPYCYTCRPTGLPAPDDTACYWAPLFTPVLNTANVRLIDVADEILLTVQDEWVDLFPGGLSIEVRVGRRVRLYNVINALASGPSPRSVEYRALFDGQADPRAINLFWYQDQGTASGGELGMSTTITGLSEPLTSALSVTLSFQIQGRKVGNSDVLVADRSLILEET
jgi:hypothetical protein